MDPEPSLPFLHAIDTNLAFGLLGILILLFCSALLSGTGVALFSLSQNDVDEITQDNNSKGTLIYKLLEKPKKLLATLMIANLTFLLYW